MIFFFFLKRSNDSISHKKGNRESWQLTEITCKSIDCSSLDLSDSYYSLRLILLGLYRNFYLITLGFKSRNPLFQASYNLSMFGPKNRVGQRFNSHKEDKVRDLKKDKNYLQIDGLQHVGFVWLLLFPLSHITWSSYTKNSTK